MDAKHRSTVTVFIWGNFPHDGREALFLSTGEFPRDGREALRCLSRGKFPHDGCEVLFHGYGVHLGVASLVMDSSTF
jgi:hypothetical protein